MRSVLEHRETDPEGSFVAVGAGLRYRFTAARRHLEVREKRRKNTILQLDTRDIHPRNTLIYTRFLEKTNQIKALMYSNRVTHDLTRTLDRARLQAIVEGDSVIAQYIYDLSQHRFAAFSEQFGAAFNLGQVHISQLSLTGPEQEYFAGSIGTYSGHAIKAHGLTLPTLLYALSERVTQDLVPIEFGADTTANRLLAASSLLNTAARALDEDFIPVNKIRVPGYPGIKAKA